MSEQVQAAPRRFRTVTGKSIGEKSGPSVDAGENTNITYVRPKQLAEDGTTGNVAEGIFEGTLPDRFDETKNNYKIRGTNGDLIIVNNCGSLASQMARVNVGSYLILEYLGQKPMEKGKMAGKLAHRFVVKIADET